MHTCEAVNINWQSNNGIEHLSFVSDPSWMGAARLWTSVSFPEQSVEPLHANIPT